MLLLLLQVSFWFGPRQATPQASPTCLPTLVLQPVRAAVLVLDSRRGPPCCRCASAFHAVWSSCLQHLVSQHGLALAAMHVEPAEDDALQLQQQEGVIGGGLVCRAVLRGEGLSAGLLEAAARDALAHTASSVTVVGAGPEELQGLLAQTRDEEEGGEATSISSEASSAGHWSVGGLMPSVSEVKRALAGAKARLPGGPTDPEVPQVGRDGGSRHGQGLAMSVGGII